MQADRQVLQSQAEEGRGKGALRNPAGLSPARASECGDVRVILVTGGAGFIGSNIAAALARRGEAVAITDRLGCDGIKWRNISRTPLEAILAPGDLDAFLRERGAEVAAVVHMGAISSTTASDADEVVAVNLRLPQQLWRWCAEHGRTFVYASSAATYGDGAAGFDDEDTAEALAALRPLNLYGWSKQAFDVWAARAVEAGRPAPPRWAGLKFFNVYGPNEGHKGDMMSLVAKSHPALASGEAVRLFRSDRPDFADGGQLRDFVYVKDCVDVVLWLLDQPELGGVYNLGTGRARSFLDLVTAAFAAEDRPVRVEYVDMPAGLRDRYQYFTQARMDRLRALGYAAPFRSVEEGVGDYVRNHLSRGEGV